MTSQEIDILLLKIILKIICFAVMELPIAVFLLFCAAGVLTIKGFFMGGKLPQWGQVSDLKEIKTAKYLWILFAILLFVLIILDNTGARDYILENWNYAIENPSIAEQL